MRTNDWKIFSERSSLRQKSTRMKIKNLSTLMKYKSFSQRKKKCNNEIHRTVEKTSRNKDRTTSRGVSILTIEQFGDQNVTKFTFLTKEVYLQTTHITYQNISNLINYYPKIKEVIKNTLRYSLKFSR